MRRLIILFGEFFLILAIIAFIYYANLSRRFPRQYNYQQPLTSVKMDLSDKDLKEELMFFLAKELGIYEGKFEVLDVVYLYTNELSGADYILVTIRAPDDRLCQITVARNFLPWAKWELSPEKFSIIEPLKTIVDSEVEVPKWMKDLGVTPEDLEVYYAAHPEAVEKGSAAFLDQKTGKYDLPADWHQTVFVIKIDDGKRMRLIPDTAERTEENVINSYWKADYPAEYTGPGYREYLYQKIKNKQ